MNDSDRYTDFINRNTADYRKEMRHMIADFIEDIVNFSDRHFVDREQTMLEVSQSLRMIPGYVADRMPGQAPAEISTNGGYNCCGHCGSIDGVLDMEGGHNKFCGNCGWPIDWGD